MTDERDRRVAQVAEGGRETVLQGRHRPRQANGFDHFRRRAMRPALSHQAGDQ